VPPGVVEATNGNNKSVLRRGRGYKNLRYLVLKARRMAGTRTEFAVFRQAAEDAVSGGAQKRDHFRYDR